MNLKLSLPNLFIAISFIIAVSCFSCRSRVYRSWLYLDDYTVEPLNGNVKQVIVTTTDKSNFYKADFDEQGNMKRSFSKQIYIAITDHTRDTTTTINTVNYTFKYDANGRKEILSGSVSSPRPSSDIDNPELPNNTMRWHFDQQGRIMRVENMQYGSGSCKYNALGDLVEWASIPDCCTYFYFRFKYDTNHRLIESDFIEQELPIYKIEYKYTALDKCGNWTKRIGYYTRLIDSRHKSKDTETRTITYY